MKRVSTTLTVAFASMLMAVGCGTTDSVTKETEVATTITETTISTTTTMTTTIAPEEATVAVQETPVEITGKCVQWYELAMRVGWPESEWGMLDHVLYRESRCNIDSHNKTDPASGSRGLMQINGFWCRPNKYTERGWLQDQGILNTCEDLFEPETNLRAGLAIFSYSLFKNKNGWHPWRV